MKNRVILALMLILSSAHLYAAEPVVDLTVSYKTINFACKQSCAIAINNQIPGPTLHFKQGDTVTINVHNKLDEKTTIHWHGLLVPWQMDGVEGISQEGILPGQTFTYKFKLEQAGTYWYHSHAGLQEQEGMYGGIIIDPVAAPQYQYNKDFMIVLSDWSNTCAEQIYANLKKDGEYYSADFPLQASLQRFLCDYSKANCAEKPKVLEDYKMMQQMGMGIYDFSDVAYDAFLLNGHTKAKPWHVSVKVGDVVRLRFIGAGSSTIFHVKIPHTTMQIVNVDGNDVKPHDVYDFTIAPGETYDVLIKIAANKPYLIYAEAINQQGSVYGALLTSDKQSAVCQKILPFPMPDPVTREMMANMHNTEGMPPMQMDHNMHAGMDMPQNNMHAANGKYANIIAAIKTNEPDRPIYKEIKMDLDGDMGEYIWFINDKPEYAVAPIKLEPGQRYRIIFTNSSMMHHPMHIHGHWFILRKGDGAYDPLLHTIDVAPGETVTADVDTNASGQWFFHCHMLYHMMAGMSRVLQYNTLPLNSEMTRHPMAHPHGLYFSNYLEFAVNPFNNTQQLTFKGLYGSDYNKLQLYTNDAEMEHGTVADADMDIFYWHMINEAWAVKAGVNYFYRPSELPYWQPGFGIEGSTPYSFEVDVRTYYFASTAKFDIEIERDTQITNNFFLNLGVRSILATKTNERAQLGNGLNQMRYIVHPYYRIAPGINIFVEYEYQRNFGAFKMLQNEDDEAQVQTSITLGIGILF